MKKKLLLATVLLTSSGLLMELAAQEHLEALVKKSENVDSVDVNVIRRRDSKTNELQHVTTTITIHSNAGLVKDFLDAFKKDEKHADRTVVETTKSKKIKLLNYRFGDTFYSFRRKNDNSAVIIVRGYASSPLILDTANFEFLGKNTRMNMKTLDLRKDYKKMKNKNMQVQKSNIVQKTKAQRIEQLKKQIEALEKELEN